MGEQASSTTRDHPHHHAHGPPRQTIVIPDTPSPAVSVITISSDTDDEDQPRHAHHRSAANQGAHTQHTTPHISNGILGVVVFKTQLCVDCAPTLK